MSELELIQEFGRRLKYELDQRWMTQKELSEETGLSTSTISYYVSGERMPSLKNVLNIAYAIDCSIEDLIVTGEHID